MSGEKMILVLFLASTVTALITCPTQTCGTNTGNLCYSYEATNNVATSQACAIDHTCGFDYTSLTKNFLCIPDPNPYEYNRWPGQKCSESKVCIDGTTCTKGYCVGVAAGGSCTSTDVCAPGYYCKTANNLSTCVALIQEKAACTAGTDLCTYGTLCYSGTCQRRNVANGQPVDVTSCIANNSPLCQSSQCAKSADGTTAICIAPYKQTGTFGVCDTCTGTSSTAGSTEQTMTCLCGLSGSAYCPGFYGDTYHAKALSIDYEWNMGSTIKKCNINAGYACMEDYWDDDDYFEYAYYTMRAADNYMIYGAKDCVLEAVAADYIAIRDEYLDSSSSSFGQLFAVSALIFTVIA